MWRRIQIPHARKHYVELYLKQGGILIEALHACESLGVCQSAQYVVGDIEHIRYDQEGSVIIWEDVKLPDYCLRPEVDCRHNEIVAGHEPRITDLSYGIANMMNQVFSDVSFSRYAKKLLCGKWECRTSNISFSEDGSYHADGDVADIGKGMRSSGVWSIGRNQLVLLDCERKGGIRTQIVQIDATCLVFHGRGNFLFQKYKRK